MLRVADGTRAKWGGELASAPTPCARRDPRVASVEAVLGTRRGPSPRAPTASVGGVSYGDGDCQWCWCIAKFS